MGEYHTEDLYEALLLKVVSSTDEFIKYYQLFEEMNEIRMGTRSLKNS